MAWIELHQTLREHKKMFACADALGLSRIEMIGTLVSLWLWALDNAQDGSLEGVSDKTIARVCDFPERKAGKLMEALHKHGWIDQIGDHYVIHDWYDYAGKLMERREKDRKRKNNSKSKPQDFRGSSSGKPEEVHGKSHATVPNHTVPNHTVPGMKHDTTQNISGTQVTIPEREVVHTAGVVSGPRRGSRQNVALTQSEYDRLLLEFGEINVTVAIETMGKWMAESGENPENHYALLRRKLWKDPTLQLDEE